jgi:hypothetical protein
MMNGHRLYFIFLPQMHTDKHGFLYLCASFLPPDKPGQIVVTDH